MNVLGERFLAIPVYAICVCVCAHSESTILAKNESSFHGHLFPFSLAQRR
jgi:hypothetical protein